METPQEENTALSFAVSIDYEDNPKNLSVKDDYDETYKDFKGPHPIYYSSSSTSTKVAGLDGFYEKNGDCEPYSCSTYAVSYKGRIWIISLMNRY